MKNVVQDLTSAGIDWQREKWQSGLGSKFIHQGEKNAAKYADEVIVLSKGVQDYFKETYGRETHFIPNGVNRPQIREANLITEKFGLKKDSYRSTYVEQLQAKGYPIRWIDETKYGTFVNFEDVNLYYIVEAAVSRVSELMRFLRRKVKTEDILF